MKTVSLSTTCFVLVFLAASAPAFAQGEQEEIFYGTPNIIASIVADALVVASMLVSGTAADQATVDIGTILFWSGYGLHSLFSPIMHFANGKIARGVGILFLRAGVPIGGVIVAAIVAAAVLTTTGINTQAAIDTAIAINIGGGSLMILTQLIDIIWYSHRAPEPGETATTGLRVAPFARLGTAVEGAPRTFGLTFGF